MTQCDANNQRSKVTGYKLQSVMPLTQVELTHLLDLQSQYVCAASYSAAAVLVAISDIKILPACIWSPTFLVSIIWSPTMTNNAI